MSQQTSTSTDIQTTNGSLVTGQGRTSIADSVVEKIAGVAAREVSGVYEMGRGAARAFGSIKGKLPVGSAGPSVTQGVKVEVGERQAAIDIDVVVEYGVSIPEVAQAVRDNVIQQLERMTGLQVTEVNITVDDVYLGEDAEPEAPRVQ